MNQCDQMLKQEEANFFLSWTKSSNGYCYLKSDVSLKKAQNVAGHLGYFWNKIVAKISSKIAHIGKKCYTGLGSILDGNKRS